MHISSTYLFFLKATQKHKIYLWAFFAICLIWAIEMSLQPLILKKMIEAISLSHTDVSQSVRHYWFYSYIAITILLSSVLRIYHYLALHFYPHIRQIIITKIHNHLMNKHSLASLEKHPGALIKATQELTSHIEICCQICIEMIIPRVLALFGANITLCVLSSPIYAGLLTCWTTIYLTITWQFMPTIMHNAEQLSSQHQKLFGWLSDTIDNHTIIMSYHQQAYEQYRLANILNQYTDQEQKLLKVKLNASIYQSINMIICLSILICMLLANTSGKTNPGTITLVIGITQAFMHATHYLGTCLINITKSISVCNHALESLQLSAHEKRRAHMNKIITPITKTSHQQYAGNNRHKNNEINFKSTNTLDISNNNQASKKITSVPRSRRKAPNLNYAVHINNLYYQSIQKNFKIHIPHLSIEIGETILIVGASGSGKSTLAKLISNHFIPTRGHIKIGSFNNKEPRQRYDHVCYIPQKPALLNRSIFDNIRLGRDDSTNDEIIELCQKCLCHDFIMRLDNQYHTIIGNSGMQLSLGQQQRIILARCLLRPAPIIIFDEATAHLDHDTEEKIFKNLTPLIGNKTCLYISHHQKYNRYRGRIITMTHGSITKDRVLK